MNKMIINDYDNFYSRFVDARRFLEAAHLRHEAYGLLLKPSLNNWQQQRLKELMDIPACQEQWFQFKIEKEGLKND